MSSPAAAAAANKLADDSLATMKRPFKRVTLNYAAAYSLSPAIGTTARPYVVAGMNAELWREALAAMMEAAQRGPNALILERDVISAFQKNGRAVPLRSHKARGYRCPASMHELAARKRDAAEAAVVNSEVPRHARHVKQLSESL